MSSFVISITRAGKPKQFLISMIAPDEYVLTGNGDQSAARQMTLMEARSVQNQLIVMLANSPDSDMTSIAIELVSGS